MNNPLRDNEKTRAYNYLLNSAPNSGFLNKKKKTEKSIHNQLNKPIGRIYAYAIGPACILPPFVNEDDDNLDW